MSQCGEGCPHPGCDGQMGGPVCVALLAELVQREQRDPVVKYDGAGQPVRASELGLNRAGRREAAREARRRR